MNHWNEIWSKRMADAEVLKGGGAKEIFFELKRSNGYDVYGENGPSYEAWISQYDQIKRELAFHRYDKNYILKSVFEVGCGSGANLYLFELDGIRSGGIDYSPNLINSAKQVLKSDDLTCGEAVDLSTDLIYDSVFSMGVFSYFANEDYAYAVMEKMCKKAEHSIGIMDIHDVEKKEAFISYRKESIQDYETRYKDLPKYFYSKDFFLDFAVKHDMDIKFTSYDVDKYWNNEFVFNCYMYKRRKVFV